MVIIPSFKLLPTSYRVGLFGLLDVVSSNYHCSAVIDTLADKMVPNAAK